MEIDKQNIYRQLMWDYNLPPDKIEDLMSGKIERLGHYSQETMFKKMLETLPWFIILEILDINTINRLLNEQLIKKIKSSALQKNYLYVKKRLQEIISAAG